MPMVASKGQIRAARGMLDWSLIDLARAADVSVSSVLCFEMRGGEALFPYVAGKIQAVLEQTGIVFLADDGDGCGVRLRAVPQSDAPLETVAARRDARWCQVIIGDRAADFLA